MCAMLAVRPPACNRRLCASAKLRIRLIKSAPSLASPAHLQLKQLSQVMAQGGNERGILPARTVAGTSEAINAAIWPPFHDHVPFELLQSLERDFQRMPVEAAGLGVVMLGAGWQIAHCYGKPL